MLETSETAPPAAPRDRSLAARRAARQAKASRESRIVEGLNRGVSLADREHEPKRPSAHHAALGWLRTSSASRRQFRSIGRRSRRRRQINASTDGRSAARRVSPGCDNIALALIILLSSAMKSSVASGRLIGFRAKFGCANQFLCYRDLIPLLFRCYSAVNSAVNSAVIPPVNSTKPRGNTWKSLNQRMFPKRFSQETAASDFFSPITEEFGFPADPKSVHGEPPRPGCRKRVMLEKYACARGRHAQGGRGGGPDSIVFGRRLSSARARAEDAGRAGFRRRPSSAYRTSRP